MFAGMAEAESRRAVAAQVTQDICKDEGGRTLVSASQSTKERLESVQCNVFIMLLLNNLKVGKGH